MSSLPRHRYTPVAEFEHSGGENEKPSRVPSPDGIKNLARTALLMVIAGIAGAFIFSVVQGSFATVPTVTATPEWARLQNLLSFPQETVKFVPNKTFASPASPQADEAWMHLLGPSKGFIALEDPKTYGLAPGRSVQGDTHQVYGVTMFHQLHCLIMIRDIYYGLFQGKYNASDYDSTGNSEQSFVFEHTEHCFDFLQQSIRCAGLMQIELPHGSRNNIFDGYGSEHTCKSWSSIMQFMYQHQTPGQGDVDKPEENSGI